MPAASLAFGRAFSKGAEEILSRLSPEQRGKWKEWKNAGLTCIINALKTKERAALERTIGEMGQKPNERTIDKFGEALRVWLGESLGQSHPELSVKVGRLTPEEAISEVSKEITSYAPEIRKKELLNILESVDIRKDFIESFTEFIPRLLKMLEFDSSFRRKVREDPRNVLELTKRVVNEWIEARIGKLGAQKNLSNTAQDALRQKLSQNFNSSGYSSELLKHMERRISKFKKKKLKTGKF